MGRLLALALAGVMGCSGWAAESPPIASSDHAAPLALLPAAPRVAEPVLPALPLDTGADSEPPVERGKAKVRMWTQWKAGDMKPAERVRLAKAEKLETVEQMFREAEVPFPPAELLLRTFKQERELEVWASDKKGGAMKQVATYAVCAMSGTVGPKRNEGDLQVPEGFYTIQYFWPESSFHISANVGYPNVSDRMLGGPRPGGEIMIHGGCASIGCIAMTDERIQELYVMSAPLQHRGDRVSVHIFPARDMGALLASGEHAAHHGFWSNLKEGLDRFESDRRLPKVKTDWQGRYLFQ